MEWWFLMYGVGAVAVALWALYLGLRRERIRRYARKHGFGFDAGPKGMADTWPDLRLLRRGEHASAVNIFDGERGGRRFMAFDCRYTLEAPGPESRAYMSRLLTFDQSPLFVMLNRPTTGRFCGAVVACRLPAGARTAGAVRGFAPWRVEIGAEAALVCTDDELRPSAEIVSAVDRLNAALDEIVRTAPAPTA